MINQSGDYKELENLVNAIEEAGISWTDLVKSADQIVIFGSRSVGLGTEESDWDILCVGSCESKRLKTVELICITPSQLETDEWLGSEFAGHIGEYGQWLKGKDNWSHRTYISKESIEKKEGRIRRLINASENEWPNFPMAYRKKYLDRIRRDLQRFDMLTKGESIPPNPILDDIWKNGDQKEEFLRLAEKVGIISTFVEHDLVKMIG